MHAVLRVDLETRPARFLHDLVNAGRTVTLRRLVELGQVL